MIEVEAFVTRVVDGDTIVVTIQGIEPLPQLYMDFPNIHLRLLAIQAPERGEVGFEEAKEMMKDIVLGRQIQVLLTGAKSFNRYIAEVIADEVNVNQAMVHFGHAKYYEYK